MSGTPGPAVGSSQGDGAADAAMARGRAHERAGRLRAAVAEYDAAYSLRADARMAERLVRLRRDAAADPESAGPAVWPRSMADPFPGAAGPPEIVADALSADVLGGAILNHGCLVVRGLLSPELTGGLRHDVDQAMEARSRRARGEPDPADAHWYRPFDSKDRTTRKTRRFIEEAGGMLTVDAPPVMWRVLDALRSTGVTEVISDYLQEPAVVSARKCVLRRVRSAVPTWHQDGSFMGGDVRSVDVWLALSECGAGTDAAGLDILPLRVDDILDTQTHGEVHLYAIGQGLVDEVGAGRSWVTPYFAPGDAILFDERFVHRSGVGEQFVADRYAIETWYFGASSVPEGYVPLLA